MTGLVLNRKLGIKWMLNVINQFVQLSLLPEMKSRRKKNAF